MRRGIDVLGHRILNVFFILTIVLTAIGLMYGINAAIPRSAEAIIGHDTLNYVDWIEFIIRYWPHVGWYNTQGAGGGVFPHIFSLYLAAVLASVLGIPPLNAFYLTEVIGVVLLCVGAYAFVVEWTKNHLSGFAGSLLSLSSPRLFALIFGAGYGPRTLATGLMILTMFSTLRFIKSDRSRTITCITIILMATTCLAHYTIGLLTAIITLLLIVTLKKSVRGKLYLLAKLYPPAFLLCSFVIIPTYFLLRGPSTILQPGTYLFWGVPFSRVLYEPMIAFLFPSSISDQPASPIMPLVYIVVAVAVLRREIRDQLRRESRILVLLGLVSLAFLMYTGTGLFILSISPWDAIVFPSIFLSLFLGISLSRFFLRTNRKKSIIAIGILCLLTLSTIFAQIPILAKEASVRIHDDSVLRGLLPEQDQTFRFWSYDITEVDWITYRYKVSQVGTALVHMPGEMSIYYSYFGGIVGNESSQVHETNFWLDWFAVKWFTAPERFAKFQNATYYKQVTKANHVLGFEYKQATPIVSADIPPLVLVIGKGPYTSIIDSLQYSDFDSRQIVTVQGSEYVDDYTLEQLKGFDAILLYGYSFHNPSTGWKLLDEYVNQGGGLFMETGLQYLSDWNSSTIPVPAPIETTKWMHRGKGEWQFTHADLSIIRGIDFSAFSPAIYCNGSWDISVSLNESVRNWARTLLWDLGKPLVVVGEYGRGRVAWCGMNLPYHITLYRNREESILFRRILDWILRGAERLRPVVDYSATRISPEKVVVTIRNETRGVLFKENYCVGWRAFAIGDQEKRVELKIYKAGPNFMLALLPEGLKYPATSTFEYDIGRIPFQYATSAISAATLVFLVLYAMAGEKMMTLFIELFKTLRDRLQNWWFRDR